MTRAEFLLFMLFVGWCFGVFSLGYFIGEAVAKRRWPMVTNVHNTPDTTES